METPKKKKKIAFSFKGSVSFPIAPMQQFRTLMLIGIAVFVLMAAAHLYLFYKIKSKDIFRTAEVQTTSVPSVNERRLNAVLARFETKAALREAALQKSPATSDPSR